MGFCDLPRLVRSHAWGTGECAVHRMRTISRRPRVQTWCARKRTLTSLELGRDGKIRIPKQNLILRIWVSAISSVSFCRTLKKRHQPIPIPTFLYLSLELMSDIGKTVPDNLKED